MKLCVFTLSAVLLICFANAEIFHTINPNNLKKVFESSLKPALADLNTVYYAVKGLSLLGVNSATYNTELCKFVQSKLDQNNLESAYFSLSMAKTIGNCELNVGSLNQLLESAIQSQNMVDLYHYTSMSYLANLPIDSAKLSTSVLDALKKDNSIVNQAYALHIATYLAEDAGKIFYDNIDDLLEQADEYDQAYLQYDGGAATTSFVLDGILKLSEKYKKLTTKLDSERIRKFVNYLSSKRHVSNSKSAYYLLELALTLSNNQFTVPVVVNRISSVSVTQANPNVLVSVTNILGRAVKQVDFGLDASSVATEQNKKPLFAGRKQLTPKSSDKTAFELALFENTIEPGFYTVKVTLTPKTNVLLVLNSQFDVKFSQEVEVVDLSVGSADREQSSPKLFKLASGKKLNDKLDADQTSKIYVRFGLKARGSFISANQVFVRFADQLTNNEIVFVAEQNADSKTYSCDVDLASHSKSFNHKNGVYNVQLFVSDPLVSNSKVLDLADINMKFGEQQQSKTPSKAQLYAPKPEIKHLFRVAEPTPSKLVSTVFTILCSLPSAVLVLIWFSLGFNISKFQFSLSAIVFHLSLAGIFGLLYCYWVQLNMFQTLRYLGALSVLAMVSGKQLLSNLAAAGVQK